VVQPARGACIISMNFMSLLLSVSRPDWRLHG
jgi:hypothetical protein